MITNQQFLYDANNTLLLKTYHSKVNIGKRIYREHHHTECELSLFVSGSGKYTVNEKEYTFSAGDIFLFGSSEHHCITDIHTELNLLNIYFEPKLLCEHSENIELSSLFFNRNTNIKNVF